MPRFHFEFAGPGGAVLFDRQGNDLPALEVAKAEARMVIRTLLKQASPATDWSGWTATIRSPDGEELFVVRFREVMGAKAA